MITLDTLRILWLARLKAIECENRLNRRSPKPLAWELEEAAIISDRAREDYAKARRRYVYGMD